MPRARPRSRPISTETVSSTAIAGGAGCRRGRRCHRHRQPHVRHHGGHRRLGREPGILLDGGAQQSVEVQANDTAGVSDAFGSGAFGFIGVGAGVDVINVKDTVDAHIAGSSKVGAGGNVQVLANAQDNVSSHTFSFAVNGVASLNGTVSIIGIGSGLDSQGLSQLQDIPSTVDNSISLNGGVPGTSASSVPGPDPSNPGQDATADTTTQALNVDGVLAADTPPADTQDYIGGTAVIAAGGGVTVSATESLPSVTATVGQGTGAGVLSVGASVGTITVAPAVLAFLGDGVHVTAGGAVGVSAPCSPIT